MLYRNVIYASNNTLAGWRAWRLRITEPGVWMVHCHILLHMVFGMQTVRFDPTLKFGRPLQESANML